MINRLAQVFVENHPTEAIQSLERVTPSEIAELLAGWPSGLAANAIGSLDPMVAAMVLSKLIDAVQVAIVARLDSNKAVALYRRLQPDIQSRLLGELPSNRSRAIRLLLKYPDHTVGAKMDPNYPTLPDDIDLPEALERVRKYEDLSANHWFTVDRNQKLTGVVSIRQLIREDSDLKVGEVRSACRSRLSALTDLDLAFQNPDLQFLQVLPIVDEKALYLGALRAKGFTEHTEGDHRVGDLTQLTGAALGELYRLGFYGLIYSVESGKREK